MAYENFQSVEEVACKFDIEVARKKAFVEQKELEVQETLFLLVTENIRDDLSYINETTICEKIISPILNIVAKNYDQLNVWSHVPYTGAFPKSRNVLFLSGAQFFQDIRINLWN
ncbi:MAG: hypothetical protein D3916_18300 [Candidatus Electrothrix sp. MAN1_4]|nr:hypothetical protein [Candidatus Electrothrix sp. MAN1_4]